MEKRKAKRHRSSLEDESKIKELISFTVSASLFEHGELMYLPLDRCACRVQRVRHSTGNGDPIEVTGMFIDWDGAKFVRKERRVAIMPYDSWKHISDLEAIPIKHHPHKETLLKELLAQGSKFCNLTGMHLRQYKGNARLPGSKRIYVSGPIMIDMFSWNYLRFGEDSYENSTNILSPDEMYLCPSEIPVFWLGPKRWVFVYVDDVKDASSQDLLAQLILRPSTKEFIMDMVKPGQGQGMVINLYGPPGTGKNMTVEAVAENLNLPVFRVNIEALEYYRREEGVRIKYILARWNAIVVIEFAGLKPKNSAFFAAFKDYSGILICISQNEHPVDEDLMKYISCSIKYDSLDQRSREAILKTQNDNLSLKLTSKQIEHISSTKLNGHQICHSARMIQRLKSTTDEHIKLVMEHLSKPPEEI